MKWFFNWISSHKLVTLLLLVVLFLLFRLTNRSIPIAMMNYQAADSYGTAATPMGRTADLKMSGESSMMPIPPQTNVAPAPDVTNRMVVQNSYLSLQVKNVNDSISQIKQQAESSGGYMVESNLSNPNEAASGQITIRVPQKQLDQLLSQFRSLSVKVVSENLQGTDVTDQYVDNDERLRVLEENKARMEDIMKKAVEVSDIANIQQQLFSLQDQIDAIKGQQNYLQKTSEMALVTVYLSTDDLALPYQPTNSWRPALVFKEAVRSIVINLQRVGSLLIWIGVYAVIIVPLLGALYILKKVLFPKKNY